MTASKSHSLSLNINIKAHEYGIYEVKVAEPVHPGIHWTIEAPPEEKKRIHAWMSIYATGKQPDVALSFDLIALPPFVQKVLLELYTIPFGETISYAELAMRVGSPRAARAVGSGCGRNPIPIILPCHRVIASSGKIGGFGLGLDLKHQLLAFEGQRSS